MYRNPAPTISGFQSGPLKGLQATKVGSDSFDPNGLGENAATFDRARQNEDQFYRDALADNGSGVNNAAVIQQQGGAISQDPGMKVFLQALHEKNAAVTPKSGFVGSHGDYPLETEARSTFDPSFQSSAVQPNPAIQALKRFR